MYDYNRRRKIGPITILFLFLFSGSIIGLAVIFYLDRGKFWDVMPYFCIPIIVLSLIFAIYNLVRRCNAGLAFILFFIIFTIGLVLSSIFGPFALMRAASNSLEEKDYPAAIEKLDSLLIDYPNSRYAPDAVREISFAYYNNNQFPDALDSFEAAISAQVVDPDKLEIMEIRQDIYFNLAQQQEDDGDYLGAAESYLDSVNILKKIRSDFPDTNAAFVAQYKIPQYIFNASLDYEKHGDTVSRIGLLEEILTDHPESDYYLDAQEAIDNAYIERAIELSSEADYDDAVEWFMKFLDRNQGIELDSVLLYKIRVIFSESPPSIIKRAADAKFREGDYFTSVFLYEILIDFNPDYLEAATDKLVESKVTLAQSSPYNEILQAVKERYIDTPGSSLLVIINRTGTTLKAYIDGQDKYHTIIPIEETVEIEVIPGEYTVLLESEDEETLPYMGIISFEEYRKYTETIEAPEEEGGS